MTNIVLFNNDLRVEDNLALNKANELGDILPVFIYDEKVQSYGEANKVWLHYALEDLNKSLNNKLLILKGDYKELLFNLIKQTNAQGVYWNRSYEPKLIELFKYLKLKLKEQGLEAESFNSSFICEPMQVLKKDDSYYKVFKPFYTRVAELPVRMPAAKPDSINYTKHDIKSVELNLLPNHSWYKDVIKDWDISEQGAQDMLIAFMDKQKDTPYEATRDIPMLDSTSKLAPYLRFGQISPQQIIAEVEGLRNMDPFVRQLIWRDYTYYLTFHFKYSDGKNLATDNFNSKFDAWQWSDNKEHLQAWKHGKTGIALVDAGMRELYATGYMHNRVRMVAASLLVKNFNIDWRVGQAWFDHCLFDADIANNAFGWQWVAGTGCDASPYYRVFNPDLQLDKFDSTRTYVNKYVEEYGTIRYPAPIIDLKKTAALAKEFYKQIK
tara:strand:- start:6928 stop:8241 length:1314 start_codon:yes stop_codon:yes gene_type:complete